MTTSAWIFMVAVWAVVIGMTVYCFARLLTSKQFTDPTLDAEHTPPFKVEDDSD